MFKLCFETSGFNFTFTSSESYANQNVTKCELYSTLQKSSWLSLLFF